MSAKFVIALSILLLLPTVFSYWGESAKEKMPLDYCFPYKTCIDCLKVKYCGWCSTPVVGGNGAQCAGFSPDTNSTPFICYGTYQTTTCILPTTATAGTGTGHPTTSTGPTTSTSSTITTTTGPNPAPPVRGFWRGLQINTGYVRGEWTFNFTSDYVEIRNPNEVVVYGGKVFSTATEMDIVLDVGNDKGKTLYGIFEQDFGPAEVFLTYAISPVGAKVAPASWGVAMNDKTYTVWALEQPKAFKK